MVGAFLDSCVHSPANVVGDLAAADKKCTTRQFESATAKAECFSQVEHPIVQQDIPFAADAYSIFQARRSSAAVEFDRDTAPVQAAWKRFYDGTQQVAAVLIAHEAGFADGNAPLRKDINKANVESVCRQTQLTERMACFSEITREIWEKDAGNTLAYYDEFQSKRTQLAREYDATSAQFAAHSAVERYNARIKQAIAEFATDASLARQAAEQQAAERKAEAQARAAEAADRLANFIGNLAVASLGVIAVVAAARAGGSAAPAPAPILVSPTFPASDIEIRPYPLGGYTVTSGLDSLLCRRNPLNGSIDCR
jgi:hypothetical protein